MKILIIGSGGREHALAWKLAQSERVSQIIVIPGNGGTNQYPKGTQLSINNYQSSIINHQLSISNHQALIDFARNNAVDLTVVGPEVPLAEGIVDDFQAAGLEIWGPTRAAARIEANKAFAKAFMQRHNIPTGHYAAFTNFEAALDYLRKQTGPIVIKASGLAAGKGVLLPNTPAEAEAALRQIMVHKEFGQAGDEVVIEERLAGPEVSVLAFCDGRHVIPMPPAQDHKRAFDNDEGPNTGGMGAYSPAPICPPELLAQMVETVLQPAINGLAEEGFPFVGILYAGLMLTENGPSVLEFNCRFGDPEAQVILPLLESNLLDIIEHSMAGTLPEINIAWKNEAAATVVMASGGYPGNYETGKVIAGLDEANSIEGVTVFHAGTKQNDAGQIVTAGGRVLNITGLGPTLPDALNRAYSGVKQIYFDAAHYRTDIGARAEHL